MSEEIRYYKGRHKVKVIRRSGRNWLVEALETFEATHTYKEVLTNIRVGFWHKTMSEGETFICPCNLLVIPVRGQLI